MSNWETLNMKLRSIILAYSLRLEKITSEILLIQLRVLKKKTKTLGNKSSSLSFKNKIDLLHDLDELQEAEYNHLLKFMEIRNQFIHNHEFNSFVKLKEVYPDFTKYLQKYFPNEIQPEENSLLESYRQLFLDCLIKLMKLKFEYISGIELDYNRYIAHEIDEKFDLLIERAKSNMEKSNRKIPFVPSFFGDPHFDINQFVLSLKIEKASMASAILDTLKSEDKLYLAFKSKIPFEEQIKKMKEESKAITTVEKKD